MADKNFFKDNFVLVIGLALPVVIMIAFMVMSSLPQTMEDPPKYDLIFSTPEWQYNQNAPVSARLFVKNGTLMAQYTKNPSAQSSGTQWHKLYRYEAATKTVRELPFGYPDGADEIEKMREEPVEATKDLTLNTVTTSPDGYVLTNESTSRGGLVNELIFDFDRDRNYMKLRKGMASVKLMTGDGTPFYYGNANFIGWVTQ